MKSARVTLWSAQASQNPKAPVLNGSVEIPAALVWELSQLMAQNQGMEVNQQTGETFFKLRLSMWRGTGENNGPVLNGQFESPSERAQYLAAKAQQGGGFGGDRITVRLRNTTGGAIVAWTKLNISPA